MKAAFPTYAETGKEFGHKKQNAEPLIKKKLSTIKQLNYLLPSLHKFAEIVLPLKYIRSSSLTEILINGGLVASKEACNINGLLRLICELGYQHNLGMFDFDLMIIKRKDYLPANEFLLIDKSIVTKMKSGIAKAKQLSGDLGLVSCSYLLEQLGDKFECVNDLFDLITHKQENICFTSDKGETYFHIGGYKNDGITNCLGKVFSVSKTVDIDELAEAIQKPIRRRQTNRIVRVMLPVSVIKQFIKAYPDTVIKNDSTVSFLGKKKGLNSIELAAEQILRENGVVKYRTLFEDLINNGYEKEFCYAEMNYSPIFCTKKDENGNYLIHLIGTSWKNFVKVSSFDDVIEDIESMSQDAERFQNKLKEVNESWHLGEEFVNQYLKQCKLKEEILQFKWVSKNRPGAPCDFVIQENDGTASLVDVKSTSGDFESIIHISYGELCKMRENEQFVIYRVYFIKDKKARRIIISEDMKDFATSCLKWFESTPLTIIPDSVSLRPSTVNWKREINFQLDTI